jgi:hypothetical protein
MRDEEKQPWDRQPYETSRSYELFCTYRDMGIKRSLRKMKAAVNGSPSVRRLQVLSARWGWVGRSRAYDDHLEREQRAQREKERLAMHDRHAKVALLGLNVAVKGLETLLTKVQSGEGTVAPGDLTRLLDTAVRVERLARGESTDSHEVSGPEGGPVRLSAEEVLRRINEAYGLPPDVCSDKTDRSSEDSSENARKG